MPEMKALHRHQLVLKCFLAGDTRQAVKDALDISDEQLTNSSTALGLRWRLPREERRTTNAPERLARLIQRDRTHPARTVSPKPRNTVRKPPSRRLIADSGDAKVPAAGATKPSQESKPERKTAMALRVARPSKMRMPAAAPSTGAFPGGKDALSRDEMRLFEQVYDGTFGKK